MTMPRPDPQAITGQLADRRARAERAWRRSRRWVARPFLLLASAGSPAQRTDIYGGTLGGWQALLAVHRASILAGQPLLIADFSGLLSGLSPAQFANALAEAIHAGTPGGAGRAGPAGPAWPAHPGRDRADRRGPVPRRLPRPDRPQPGPPRRVRLR
jgi:hypothetical protein